MGADLGADAVLEGRDDLAARGVVLRIRRERHHDVERHADRIPLDLDVALLKDVEQADLDLAGQVGQLVDGEDAAVRARQQAVVDGQLVGELQPAPRRLDRIDVADHVGDRHVRRRQLLDEPLRPRQPGDGQAIAFLPRAGAPGGAERRVRIAVDLAPGHHGQLVVEQVGQRAQDARLRLSAQSQDDQVVPREDRVADLRDDRLVVADDAGKQRLAAPQLVDQVVAELLPDAAPRDPTCIHCVAQVAQHRRSLHPPSLPYMNSWIRSCRVSEAME
ncbi:MAG: hypothetical protein F4057_09435 [Acidobacteria bacterium]|nr:hypothetical protein [Acidobacteriota bacterium]